MNIESEVHDTHASLVLKGEFETDDAKILLEQIDASRAKGVKRLAVSLRFVKYMNSTALGTLVRARKLLQADGGDLVVVRPSLISREVIQGMGLEGVIPMFDDEGAAIAALTSGSGPIGKGNVGGAGDADGEGLGPGVVLFSFADDRTDLFPGRTRRGVGTVQSVDSQKLVFHWNPESHSVQSDAAAKMFATGSSIHLKFQVKILRKDYFDLNAKIDGSSTGDDGTVAVTATWDAIGEADKAALSQFTQDVEFLTREREGS